MLSLVFNVRQVWPAQTLVCTQVLKPGWKCWKTQYHIVNSLISNFLYRLVLSLLEGQEDFEEAKASSSHKTKNEEHKIDNVNNNIKMKNFFSFCLYNPQNCVLPFSMADESLQSLGSYRFPYFYLLNIYLD